MAIEISPFGFAQCRKGTVQSFLAIPVCDETWDKLFKYTPWRSLKTIFKKIQVHVTHLNILGKLIPFKTIQAKSNFSIFLRTFFQAMVPQWVKLAPEPRFQTSAQAEVDVIHGDPFGENRDRLIPCWSLLSNHQEVVPGIFEGFLGLLVFDLSTVLVILVRGLPCWTNSITRLVSTMVWWAKTTHQKEGSSFKAYIKFNSSKKIFPPKMGTFLGFWYVLVWPKRWLYRLDPIPQYLQGSDPVTSMSDTQKWTSTILVDFGWRILGLRLATPE